MTDYFQRVEVSGRFWTNEDSLEAILEHKGFKAKQLMSLLTYNYDQKRGRSEREE